MLPKDLRTLLKSDALAQAQHCICKPIQHADNVKATKELTHGGIVTLRGSGPATAVCKGRPLPVTTLALDKGCGIAVCKAWGPL